MPKKKKGGKKGKGPKKEEETPEQKEERCILLLTDKLQREKKTRPENLQKLNQLNKDIDSLQQTFEKQLVDKDNVINGLMRDLSGAEYQTAQVQQLHLENLARLRALQEKRLMLLQEQWEDVLQCQNFSFESDKDQMLGKSEQRRNDLTVLKLGLEKQYQKVTDEIQSLYSEIIAFYQSAHEDRRAVVVLEGVMMMNEKTQKEEDIVELHNKEEKELNNLVLKTQQYIQATDKSMRRVKKLQDSVLHSKVKLKTTKSDTEALERDLPAARNEAKKITHKLRHQLSQSQLAARKQLTVLTVQTNLATKKLHAVIAKGERVARVAQLCGKLESKQENVFLSALTDADHQAHRMRQEETKASCQFAALRHVMHHSNVTVLQRDALRKCNKDLRRENQHLRLLLHRPMSPVNGINHALLGHQSLLTVKPAPIFTAPFNTDRCQTEGGVVVQNKL